MTTTLHTRATAEDNAADAAQAEAASLRAEGLDTMAEAADARADAHRRNATRLRAESRAEAASLAHTLAMADYEHARIALPGAEVAEARAHAARTMDRLAEARAEVERARRDYWAAPLPD